MKAYVELVQSRERELGTDTLTHQKVHLANLFLELYRRLTKKNL